MKEDAMSENIASIAASGKYYEDAKNEGGWRRVMNLVPLL